MVIAALVAFGILLVAWMLAPDRHESAVEADALEVQLLAA
jgi:hypothetical protein